MKLLPGYATLFGLDSLSDGEPVPQDIDESFSDAEKRISIEGGFKYKVAVIALRTYHMWTDQDHVFGWFYLSHDTAYWYLREIARYERVFYLFLLGLCWTFTKYRMCKILIMGIFVMVVSRTVFLASLTALEIRYLIPVLPAMQFAAIAFWAAEGSRQDVSGS
jgi:hypothetical protein